jgi:hypothetical protein
MPAVYSPADTLARISNKFFAKYANDNKILTDLNIKKLKESDIAPILEKIKELPDDIREKVEQDLRHIAELSDKKRINILFSALKEAAAESLPEFKKIGSGHDKAIWALIHYPELFHKAVYLTSFHIAPGTFTKFPYKTSNNPDLSKTATDLLGKKIREYFQNYDGRGKYCIIDTHQFNSKHYIIANPSEHLDVKREYKNGGKLEPTKRQDAFIVVFIFSDTGNAVDIYVNAALEVKRALFSVWAKEIMGLDSVDTKFKPSYKLDSFKTPEHDLQFPANSRVKSIAIYKMYFVPLHDPSKTYEISANISENKKALYEELEAKKLKPIYVRKVWIEATLQEGDKEITKRFRVGESYSDLKHDGIIADALRQFLKDVGIDITK